MTDTPSKNTRITSLFAEKGYDLLGELGRGGMGVVYLAKDRKLGRKVALKTLSPERVGRDNSLRRFEREARTFAQIRHPHIAALYEFQNEGQLWYLALEYIDGFDLESERRRGKKWPHQEAARVIRAVASALECTHAQGVLHRDIKPGNILVERATNRVVLTDFGLAKGSEDETLTAIGYAVGTPAYMAPEQISDQFRVEPDGRADVFSLGTVFYEMLTAKHPFIGTDDLKTMRNIVHTPPRPIREIEPSVPAGLEAVIMSMLEKDPRQRIGSAREVASLLEKWVGEASTPAADTQATVFQGAGAVAKESNSESAALRSGSGSQAGQKGGGLVVSKIVIVIAILAFIGALLGGVLIGALLK